MSRRMDELEAESQSIMKRVAELRPKVAADADHLAELFKQHAVVRTNGQLENEIRQRLHAHMDTALDTLCEVSALEVRVRANADAFMAEIRRIARS